MGNNRQLREMHLFAGAGGGILGGLLCGHRPVCAVEIEEYPRKVLLQRQIDGVLPKFPIWDDVCTFDGKPWRGSVDVICGGFPCQDISAAGKGAGITGARSGLWKEYARIIGEVRPKYVFAENSPLLRTRGLGVVLEDLAKMGYDARWGVLGAWHTGAPHKRDRMWVLANTNVSGNGAPRRSFDRDGEATIKERGYESQLKPGGHGCAVANTTSEGLEGTTRAGLQRDCERPAEQSDVANTNRGGSDENTSTSELRTGGIKQSPKDSWATREGEGHEGQIWGGWWDKDPAEESSTESYVGRVAHGVANRVERLKAIGNGQVPSVARLAWNVLSRELT